jgi:hypothetical protein
MLDSVSSKLRALISVDIGNECMVDLASQLSSDLYDLVSTLAPTVGIRIAEHLYTCKYSDMLVGRMSLQNAEQAKIEHFIRGVNDNDYMFYSLSLFMRVAVRTKLRPVDMSTASFGNLTLRQLREDVDGPQF